MNQVGAARPDALYALTLGVKDPAQLQGNDAVCVTVKDAQGEVESKWLHAADLDFYLTLRPRSGGPGDRKSLRRFDGPRSGDQRNTAARSSRPSRSAGQVSQ